MTEEYAHPLQESDLDHHEADPDQGEIDGAAHGQLPAASLTVGRNGTMIVAATSAIESERA